MHGHSVILNLDICWEYKTFQNGTIVEIGSERGHGSTEILARFAKEHKLHFVTVDILEEVWKNVQKILEPIDETFIAVCSKGEDYLKQFTPNNIVILYLDAFDITVKGNYHQPRVDEYAKEGLILSNENAWKMHLEACKHGYDKVRTGGFIVFDDTWLDKKDPTKSTYHGKGKTAIPFLLDNGYKIYSTLSRVTVLQRRK